MKILFLAPQPFFEERGTPIAVKLALDVLAKRTTPSGTPLQIDLLTYGLGSRTTLGAVNQHRSYVPGWIRLVSPGISLNKLICDFFFVAATLRLVWLARGENQYRLIHAVEESVFIALLVKLLFGIPYVYDMDSSLTQQLTEKWVWLRPIAPLLSGFERLAARSSAAVVPVCDALATIACSYGCRNVNILRDVPLIRPPEKGLLPSLRDEIGLPPDAVLLTYIGNLEGYQGIDLMIEGFARHAERSRVGVLVIIGGAPRDVSRYRRVVEERGVAARVHLVGARPLEQLGHFCAQSDLLLSPRVRGTNTPMKIYSYLHSGKAIIATRLLTHTQVLNDQIAELCDPTPDALARSITALAENPERRAALGARAVLHAQQNYTYEVFSRSLNDTYDSLLGAAGPESAPTVDDAVSTAVPSSHQ